MLVYEKGDPRFGEGVGIRDYIVDIVAHQGGTLAFGNFIGGPEKNDVPVIEVEGGGPHDNPEIIQGLMHGLVATLYKLGMIDEKFVEILEAEEQRRFDVTTYMEMPSGGYKFASNRGNFGAVSAGETLAVDTSATARPAIVAPHDGNLVMPPPYDKVIDGGDDWWLSQLAVVSMQRAFKARLTPQRVA